AAALRRGAAGPPPPGRVEDRAEQIAQAAEITQVVHGEAKALLAGPGVGPRATGAGPAETTEPRKGAHLPHLVVLPAPLRVRQHAIRLADLLEALRRGRIVGVRVRVVLLRQLAIRLLDLVRAGRF